MIVCAGISGVSSAPALAAGDPVPVQLPPTNDSIAAAKRDLDSLKTSSTTATAGTQSGAMPTIQVPALPRGDAVDSLPTPTQSPTDAAMEAEKKKANWLVDAMMNPKDTHAVDRNRNPLDRRHRTSDVGLDPAAKKTDLEHAAADDPKAAVDEPGDPTKRQTVPNPLTRYLGDWMSPQDYALLRQTIEASARRAASSDSAPAGSPVAVPGADALNSFAGFDVDAIAAPRSPKPITPADNPYLATMTIPDATPPTAPVTPPASTNLAPPPPLPAPSVEPAKPTVPDFAKPLNDSKSFDPLKRF